MTDVNPIQPTIPNNSKRWIIISAIAGVIFAILLIAAYAFSQRNNNQNNSATAVTPTVQATIQPTLAATSTPSTTPTAIVTSKVAATATKTPTASYNDCSFSTDSSGYANSSSYNVASITDNEKTLICNFMKVANPDSLDDNPNHFVLMGKEGSYYLVGSATPCLLQNVNGAIKQTFCAGDEQFCTRVDNLGITHLYPKCIDEHDNMTATK